MLAEDSLAIESAYARHHAQLERHLAGLVRDPDEGRDLADEAFLRLTSVIVDRRAPGNPEAWLSTVGKNLAFSRMRHRSVVDKATDRLPRPTAPEVPESLVLSAELWRAIASVIDQLGEIERQALVLAAAGYRATEIGVVLGRTPGATRTLLCRARAKVQHRLVDEGLASIGRGPAATPPSRW